VDRVPDKAAPVFFAPGFAPNALHFAPNKSKSEHMRAKKNDAEKPRNY